MQDSSCYDTQTASICINADSYVPSQLNVEPNQHLFQLKTDVLAK